MQHAAYIFLDRLWEKDQHTIKTICGYYKSCQAPLSVCILNIIFYLIFIKERSYSMLYFYSLNRNNKRYV